jgi:hypothetical protein
MKVTVCYNIEIVAFSTTQVRPMLAGFTAFQRGD